MTRIIIKAVPERGSYIRYLRERLPRAEWCFDKKRCAFDTFLRSLEMAGNDPAIHMEEDIWLTRHFVSKIEFEIAERPTAVIQFFSMRKADLEVGSRWDGNFLMNQCSYFPAGYSRLLREYFDVWKDERYKTGETKIEKHPNGTDQMICDWLKSRREKYWIHVPSLVDHRIGRSVIDRRRSSKRGSLTFEDGDYGR